MKAVVMERSELVHLATEGDPRAFNELVLEYQDQVFSQAYYFLGDYDAAEDIVQDTFLLAFRRMYQFRHGSFRTWLLRIATNLCYDALGARKRHRLQPLEPINRDGEADESPYWIRDPNLLPEESVEIRESLEAIQRGLSDLHLSYRLAVILVDIQQLNYQEAASTMHTSIGTLKSRLARGRLMLASALRKMDGIKSLARESAGSGAIP